MTTIECSTLFEDIIDICVLLKTNYLSILDVTKNQQLSKMHFKKLQHQLTQPKRTFQKKKTGKKYTNNKKKKLHYLSKEKTESSI